MPPKDIGRHRFNSCEPLEGLLHSLLSLLVFSTELLLKAFENLGVKLLVELVAKLGGEYESELFAPIFPEKNSPKLFVLLAHRSSGVAAAANEIDEHVDDRLRRRHLA